MKYLVVIENTSTGYSAYSPDLPGCIATADTKDDVQREMQHAIAFHLDGLRLIRGDVRPGSLTRLRRTSTFPHRRDLALRIRGVMTFRTREPELFASDRSLPKAGD